MLVTNELLRLVFARGLRLLGKWRDVVDSVRVALVHAPDVPARTAIVRDSSELARERQIPGGILPARRTGRSLDQVSVSRHKRFAQRCAPSGQFCKAEVVGSDHFRLPGGNLGNELDRGNPVGRMTRVTGA